MDIKIFNEVVDWLNSDDMQKDAEIKECNEGWIISRWRAGQTKPRALPSTRGDAKSPPVNSSTAEAGPARTRGEYH